MQISQNENYCTNPNKVTLCSNHAAVLQCDYCGDCDLQTQRHLLENCDGVIAECPAVAENIRVEHDDIFGPVEKQKEVVKLYHKIQVTINRINDTTN